MKRAPLRFTQWLAYLVFRGFEAVAGRLPLGIGGALGSALGAVFRLLAVPYRRLARRNLRLAFGDEKSDAEIDRLVGRHFRALGRNLMTSFRIGRMTVAEIEKRVDYEGRENMEAAVAAGRGLVGAIAHLGPWELLAQLPSLGQGVAPGTLFQPLRNPFINRFIVERRARAGTRLFDRSTGVYGPLKHLRDGGGVGVLMDQHAGDHGIWVPFFGRLASTTNLPALLAQRTGAAVLSILLLPNGPGRWKIVYGPPHFLPEKPDDLAGTLASVTSMLNRELEAAIRRAPEEWFWVHNRWKTPEPRMMLAKVRRGVFPQTAPGSPGLKPFRLLVRSPNPLGDACMAVPAIRALRTGRPDLHLTILCRENLAPLWRRQPDVDEVLTLGRKESPRSVGRRLRETASHDAALLFPNSLRAALEAWWGDIPRIDGFRGHHRRWLLDTIARPAPIGPPRHHAHSYLRLAAATGVDISDEDSLFAVPDPPEPGRSSNRLGICPGAEYGEAKRWPVERFAEVARQARAATGCAVSVFGSPGETPIGEAFSELAAFPHDNRVGKTSIDELIEELRGCRVVLTNDTGTMHLAAALGVPTVAIFGSTEPAWTRPLGPNHQVIRRHVECSPCFLRECPLDFRCMREIDTDAVVRAVVGALSGDRV
ncbi:MAG: lipopolysaccharide heptosyltransferase II [Verrucomicrobiae bacterium]|nr:lipopolysaccharide heptosyltransferase II [Verrucomicrobiae bacterium]